MTLFGSSQSGPRDAVVTGIGLVTPLGIGRTVTWDRVLRGDRAGRQLRADEITHREELTRRLGHPPAGAPVDHELVRQTAEQRMCRQVPQAVSDFQQHFAHDCLNNLIACCLLEACEDAQLTLTDLRSQPVGCVIGTSKASLRAMENESLRMTSARGHANRDDTAVQNWFNAFLPDAPLRTARFLTQSVGPSNCPVAACATGLISAVEGATWIESGLCDVCLVGSADASLRASVMAGFQRLGVLSADANPAAACRPFDADRNGFIIGEGAAVMVLESRQHAEARQAVTYGRLVRGAWRTDPTGMTQVDGNGSAVTSVLKAVIHEAESASVDHINLHGTATDLNDLAEANGCVQAFCGSVPDCSAVKGAIGHLLGAAGSVELALSLLSLRDQTIPPTANHFSDDPACPVALLPAARHVPLRSVVKLSLGFGGHVAGCLLRPA